jgi:RimJ/RimL family protein N-acetyltransferase
VDRISRRGGVQNVWQGPAFCFPEALSGGGGAVRVTEANAEVLSPRFEDWLGDVSEDVPMAAVLEDGKAVSICCSVRLTSEAHEAGVETHEDFRGRGHGAAATAAWARAVREMDRMPLYSTSWRNYASRALASRLGLIQFGVDLHIT